MAGAPRTPPRYVPTLTEVVQPAAAPAEGGAVSLEKLQEQMIHRVMQRVDLSGKVGTAAIDANDARQLGLGYVHNLSKRTALYSSLTRFRNDANAGAGGLGRRCRGQRDGEGQRRAVGGEILHEPFAVPAAHRDCHRLFALPRPRHGGNQGEAGIADQLCPPGQRQRPRRGEPHAQPGKAAGAKRDRDPRGAAPVGQGGDHRSGTIPARHSRSGQSH